MNDFVLDQSYFPESRHHQRAVFSIRSLIYFFTWLCLWQGWQGSTSVFQLNFLIPVEGLMGLHELFLMIVLILMLLERSLMRDFTFARSYFSAPILLMAFALVLSWIRGMAILQEFRPVYEMHESILIPISFFIFLNAFRSPRERGVLLVMFLFAAIMKSADSIWIKYFVVSEKSSWGSVLFWRDGFILAMGVVSMFLLIHYRGKKYRWLRKVMYFGGPFILYGLLASFRRTAIISVLVSIFVMFFTIGRGRIRKHTWMLLAFLFGLAVFILFIDPIGIITRFVGGIMMPSEEGSAYIRLMEYPNIIMNIYHNPLFGVPIPIFWHQYYQMPLFANYTSLGTHNTYLYFQLRTGIIGSVAFFWFLGRAWKAVLINLRIQRTEEDFLFNQMLLFCFVVYNVSCFSGAMVVDAMNIMTGFVLVFLQLQIKHSSELISYKDVRFWQTVIQKKLVFKKQASRPFPQGNLNGV
jgi:hypothetical protein